MRNAPRLDSGIIDRLLSGRVEPDDAPPRYASVAGLVRALSAPAFATELAREAIAVAAATVVVTAASRARERLELAGAEPTRRRSRFYRAKVTSLVVIGTLLGTTGLAAAGVLPDPVQDAVHRILSTVGIDVPSAHDHPNTGEGSSVDTGDDQGDQAPDAGDAPGQSDQPHGQSDQPHGKSDQPHGKSDQPHGNGNA